MDLDYVETFQTATPLRKKSDQPQNRCVRKVGRPAGVADGRYKAAAEILQSGMDAKGYDRKSLAADLELGGGVRTLANWLRGETWPREIGVRAKLRRFLGNPTVDAIEREVMKVLGLPYVSPRERRVLEAYSDPAGMKAIDDAIAKLEQAPKPR